MPITVDCGEGKHDLCIGTGHTAYLFPQESRKLDEPPFYCGCRCHHDGTGTPCKDITCLIDRSSLGTPEAKAIRALTPPAVRNEILRRVDQQLGAAVEHPIAGTIYPHEAPCSSYLPDGRSEICAHCDWAEEAHT